MAVSMISMNSIGFSNYDSASGGGSSGLLDFSAPSSGDASAASATAMPIDQTAMGAMDSPMMGMDTFQASVPMGDDSPPPQATPGPSGGFDFVA